MLLQEAVYTADEPVKSFWCSVRFDLHSFRCKRARDCLREYAGDIIHVIQQSHTKRLIEKDTIQPRDSQYTRERPGSAEETLQACPLLIPTVSS